MLSPRLDLFCARLCCIILSTYGVNGGHAAKRRVDVQNTKCMSNLEVHQPQGQRDAMSEGRSLPHSFHCYAMKESFLPLLCHEGVLSSSICKSRSGMAANAGCFAVRGGQNSSPNQQPVQEVHQPQGRRDAMSEGRSLPLSFHCYAMKESCPPPSANPRPGWPSVQGVLPSEVTKIHAQISSLEVHHPQGQRDAMSEGRSLPLSFHCYAMKESCPPPTANPRPGWL